MRRGHIFHRLPVTGKPSPVALSFSFSGPPLSLSAAACLFKRLTYKRYSARGRRDTAANGPNEGSLQRSHLPLGGSSPRNRKTLGNEKVMLRPATSPRASAASSPFFSCRLRRETCGSSWVWRQGGRVMSLRASSFEILRKREASCRNFRGKSA